MNEPDLYIRIKNLIESGIDAFNVLEDKVSIRMISQGTEYRKYNERPIAALMTDHIASGFPEFLYPVTIQELPLEGKSEHIINKIVKIMESINVAWVKHPKYQNYNIDGFVSLLDGQTNKDIFFEYKSEEKFDELKLLSDYVKYLIYVNDATMESYFVYVSFNKDLSGTNSFSKRVGPPELINVSVPASDDAIYHYCKNLPSIHLNKEAANSILETVITLDCYKENILSKPLVEEVHNFDEDLFYINRDIYGKNALLSYKARVNAFNIVTIARQIVSAERMVGNIDSRIYSRIKETISSLRILKVGSNIKTNASKRLSHQSTNWLLAMLEVGIKEFWPQFKGDSQFQIEDRDSNGKPLGSRPGDYEKMKKTIEAKCVYGFSNHDAQIYGNQALNLRDWLLSMGKGEAPQKSAEFRDLSRRMMYHINKIYTKILILEPSQSIAKFNNNFKNFKIRKKEIEVYNKIKTVLPPKIKKKLKIDYSSSNESVKLKMREILIDLINKWNV